MVLGDTRLRRRHRVDETELVAMCQFETIRPKGVCVWKKPCAGKLGIESQSVFLSYWPPVPGTSSRITCNVHRVGVTSTSDSLTAE